MLLLLLFSCKSCPSLFTTLWTVAPQVPLSVGFPRQEYWCGLPFPSPGSLSNTGIELVSPALAGGLFITESPGKPKHLLIYLFLPVPCMTGNCYC